MGYKIIDNLPIDFDFFDKTKQQLKEYGKWFEYEKENRLAILRQTVKDTEGFYEWEGDFSVDSLKPLGRWLKLNIKTKKLSKEAYEMMRRSVPEYIDIRDWDMTPETYSKIIDVGIYFGEVFIRNNSGLKWKQYFSTIKRDAYNGHMLITGGKTNINPIWLVRVLASSMADNSQSEERLFELHGIWQGQLREVLGKKKKA